MRMQVLLADPLSHDPAFVAALSRDAPDLDLRFWADDQPHPETELLVTWTMPEGLRGQLPRLRAIVVFGAGVDQLRGGPDALPDVPVVRLLDPGQPDRMLDYVTAVACAQLVGLPGYRRQQQVGTWAPRPRRNRREFRIVVLGLGRIGAAVAHGLARFGFVVSGWSARPRAVESVTCFFGENGLAQAAEGADLAVCLLPLTPLTTGILGDALFRRLRPGAAIVNAGRGGHLVEADLQRALDEGWLSHAWLDTFAHEPLPPAHWAWHDPRITVTPHIGAPPSPEGAAQSVARVIAALRRNAPLPGVVDLTVGYDRGP